MFACFVIYVGNVILDLDFVRISIDIFLGLHSCVKIFMRGMFRDGYMFLGSLFWVKKSFSLMVFSYSVFFLLVNYAIIIFVLCWMTLGRL